MTQETWQFAHVNDSHLGTGRSYRFRPAMNRRWAAIRSQIAASNVDLLLHGGDTTRDGDTHLYEYEMARADLDIMPFPTFYIPGNMDVGNKHTDKPSHKQDDRTLNMTSDRLRRWSTYFGPPHWTFVHKNVRFTGFYAAVAGSGLHEEQMFWDMLDRLPSLPHAQHHVAMMHYWPFMDSVDEKSWDITKPDEYLSWYFSIDREPRLRMFEKLKAANVNVLFAGHVHTGRPVEYVDDIAIYKTPGAGNNAQMQNRWDDVETRCGFQLCTVTGAGIKVQFVPGDNQEPDDDGNYGPHGHPSLADRDYSVATEKPPLQVDSWLL